MRFHYDVRVGGKGYGDLDRNCIDVTTIWDITIKISPRFHEIASSNKTFITVTTGGEIYSDWHDKCKFVIACFLFVECCLLQARLRQEHLKKKQALLSTGIETVTIGKPLHCTALYCTVLYCTVLRTPHFTSPTPSMTHNRTHHAPPHHAHTHHERTHFLSLTRTLSISHTQVKHL